MTKRNLILTSAIAAALGLGATSANAGALAFAAAPDFATQGIPASGAVTINGGVVYTFTAGGAGDTGLLTMTLPTGVTFASTPAAAISGVGSTIAVAGGGAGSNFVTYNVTTATVAAETVTLNAFQITGATALASPTTAANFQLSAQASGMTAGTRNDAAAVKAGLATSSSQLILTPVAAAATIDVATKNGTNFVVAGNTIARAASLGTLIVNNGTARNAANTAAYAFTAATASASVTGDFTGISGAYLAAGAGACAATVPVGATTGVVAASSISFSAITPGAAAREVCVINDNATLLRANNNLTVSATQDTSTTTSATKLGPVTYNGTVVTLNYAVGSTTGGYTNYFRVTNQTGAAARVIAVVNQDTGVVHTGTLAAAMPGNTNTLFTVADVNTATGSTLSSATDRAQIVFLSPSAITVNNLMFNPNGTVVTMP